MFSQCRYRLLQVARPIHWKIMNTTEVAEDFACNYAITRVDAVTVRLMAANPTQRS